MYLFFKGGGGGGVRPIFTQRFANLHGFIFSRFSHILCKLASGTCIYHNQPLVGRLKGSRETPKESSHYGASSYVNNKYYARGGMLGHIDEFDERGNEIDYY